MFGENTLNETIFCLMLASQPTRMSQHLNDSAGNNGKKAFDCRCGMNIPGCISSQGLYIPHLEQKRCYTVRNVSPKCDVSCITGSALSADCDLRVFCFEQKDV